MFLCKRETVVISLVIAVAAKSSQRMLQKDSTTNIKEIASQLNMTKTPIYERIKRLEKEAIIEKYVAVVDRKKITSSIIVFFFIKLGYQ